MSQDVGFFTFSRYDYLKNPVKKSKRLEPIREATS